jgi:hypothetical protein
VRRLSLAVGIVAASCSGSAQAQSSPAPRPEPTIDIAWQGPADCERGEAVRAKVTRLLGGSERAANAKIKVAVDVRREKGRYVAVLETESASGGGKKRLEGESCAAIALATSVVIALSVDPDASLEPEAPEEKPPEPDPEPVPAPEPAPPRPPPKAPAPARVTRAFVQASVGVLFGLLHEASASFGGGLGVRHRRLSLELAFALHQRRDVTHAERPELGAELSLATGELLGCYAAVPSRSATLELCPGIRLEHLSASAFGASDPDEARVLIGSGLAVLRGRFRATSWLSAQLDVGVAARPFRPRFVLVGVGNVFETPAFSPFARSGLVLEF